jgi:integrase
LEKDSERFARVVEAANDRAPTMEEIKKLLEYPDRRIKAIVYIMISSGIRIGAFDYLKWKHAKPVNNDTGEILGLSFK